MPQPIFLQSSDGKRSHESWSSISTPPCGVGSAAFVLADDLGQRPQRASQDPFAYYKAFHGPNVSLSSTTHELTQDDDGYNFPTGIIGSHGYKGAGYVQQARMRTVPYQAAVRLANRSNGAPLATIIEQGSYSTLNSHGSLLSVGRFPSIRTAEHASPARGSHKVSGDNSNENALHRIYEDDSQERDAPTGKNAHPKPQGCGSSHPIHSMPTPMKVRSSIYPYSPSSQISDTDADADGRPVRDFFRGVVQNVRAASRTRSRSSSASFVDAQENRPGTTESSPLHRLPPCDNSNQRTHQDCYELNLLQTSSSSAASTPASGRQARSRKTCVSVTAPSAHATPSLVEPSLATLEQESRLGFIPHLLPPSAATRPRETPPSVRLVPSEPRDVAYNAATAEAATLSNHSDGDASARNTFYGVTVAHKNASPHLDHARETRRNASFCSTMSTSYSETVLGVDLDLEHEFPHPVHHSSSPMPVWFTPQKLELERQASTPESPETKPADVTEITRRSITSSALTSLLPIAAASGIVQTNYNTPKISFYSPSGRLIQPEWSSSPETSRPVHDGSPAITTSYYNKITASPARNNLAPLPYLPPARPTLVPMTTPPTITAQLPAHLRHHHNYRHPEKSQIVSCETLFEPSPAVKGCDGIVRTDSLSPISGVRHTPHKKTKSSSQHKQHRSSRSIARDLRSDANFYKSRFIHRAVQSCSTTSAELSRKRDRSTLHKRHSTRVNPAYPPARGGQPQIRPTGKGTRPTLTNNKPKTKTNSRRDEEKLGPATGHALRICFCQPYDGAGKQTRIAVTSDLCSTAIDPRAALAKAGTVDHETEPAVRVAKSTTQKKKATHKGKSNMATAAPGARKKGDSATGARGARKTVTVVG